MENLPHNEIDLLSKVGVGFDENEGVCNSKESKQEQHVLPQWSWEKHVVRLAE